MPTIYTTYRRHVQHCRTLRGQERASCMCTYYYNIMLIQRYKRASECMSNMDILSFLFFFKDTSDHAHFIPGAAMNEHSAKRDSKIGAIKNQHLQPSNQHWGGGRTRERTPRSHGGLRPPNQGDPPSIPQESKAPSIPWQPKARPPVRPPAYICVYTYI